MRPEVSKLLYSLELRCFVAEGLSLSLFLRRNDRYISVQLIRSARYLLLKLIDFYVHPTGYANSI